MPAKTIILFDIDHTLFDAALYREKIFKILSDRFPHDTNEEFKTVMEEIYFNLRKEMNFEPTIFIERLVKKTGAHVDELQLEQALLDTTLISSFLFSETEEAILALSEIGDVRIGIFSGGRSDMQLKKIAKVRHLLLAEDIHIIPNNKELKLSFILKKYPAETVYIVDDVLPILRKAHNLDKDVITVWSKRGRFAKNQTVLSDFTPNYEITDLRQLLPIIMQSKPKKKEHK